MAYIGREALTCAELSELVYELPYRIRSRIGKIVGNAQVTVRTIPSKNSRILVAIGSTAIYVVFRGTVFKGLRSWQTNLATNRKNWMSGKVHGGFLGVLNLARPFFRPILAQCSNHMKDVYFTGHSQGGAVAFLAAIDNSRPISTSRISRNYTFGQPRAGNNQFCRSAEIRLRGSCSRVVNGRDLVVGLPIVLQGYGHFREYLHYGANGKITRRRQNMGSGWFHANINDHFMANYRALALKNVDVSI